MASGKSSVGRELALRTGRPFIDLDSFIEERTGLAVAAIFAEEGEESFRCLERETLAEIAELEGCVVALGGGVLVEEDNRRIVEASGRLVVLEVSPGEVRARTAGQKGVRPLLQEGTLEDLLERRRAAYAGGDLRVATDGRDVAAVAEAVRLGLGLPERAAVPARRLDSPFGQVVVGDGILADLPELLRGRPAPFVVGDDLTLPLYAGALGERAGAAVLPRGEEAKTLEQVRRLYGTLSGAGIDRAGSVAALGGGTVGDTAGFAAATWMRGVALIQCPTTLLAQVDSSMGGKVGVNLPEGKNLVGAFHQPELVLADVGCLVSLGGEDYRQGLAEVVKYGLGEDPPFLSWLERHVEALRGRDRPTLVETVARCAACKLAVVAEDEKERTGARARLNLGHTVGHALEAASGYRGWRHGDAVAAGMVVAAHLACSEGICEPATLRRLTALLEALGLPRRPDRPWPEVVRPLLQDKKFERGRPRLVLPRTGSRAEVVAHLPLERLEAAYEAVRRGETP